MVSIEIIGKSNQKPITRCKTFLNSSTQQGKEGNFKHVSPFVTQIAQSHSALTDLHNGTPSIKYYSVTFSVIQD